MVSRTMYRGISQLFFLACAIHVPETKMTNPATPPVEPESEECRIVRAFLEPIHARWKDGAREFTLQAKGERQPHHKQKVIRSAVYGDMTFRAEEMLLIESFYLQRTRHISQMGLLNLVYPDARHSRFEHMLGVLHSLKGLVWAAKNRSSETELEDGKTPLKQELSQHLEDTWGMAAVLHDIGHGPFSHTTELLLKITGVDAWLHDSTDGAGEPHERRCRDMLLDSDVQLVNVGATEYGLKRLISKRGLNPGEVSDIITGSPNVKGQNLISGHFDVDKMDYTRRDAFFTGTRGGGFDTDALQRWVCFVEVENKRQLAFDQRAVLHLLHFLFARVQIYGVTAHHPAVRIAAALLLIAGDFALRALPPDAAALLLANLELMNDRELISVLEAVTRKGQSDDFALLRRVLQRIETRRLPKRLATLSPAAFERQFGEVVKELRLIQGGTEGPRVPPLVYCRISAIADGKYCAYLGADDPRDDFAILEMSPSESWEATGPVSDNCKELATLREILIADEDDGEAKTLFDWLELNGQSGAARSFAEALRAYKRATWRGLVLVPASLKNSLQSRAQKDQFMSDFAAALHVPANRYPYVPEVAYGEALRRVERMTRGWRGELELRRASEKKRKPPSRP